MVPSLDGVRTRLHTASLSPISRQVRRERLTYLLPARLLVLERALKRIRAKDVPGDVLECGIALGGSGIVLASRMGDGRAFHGYDVFSMIPAPGERDGADAHDRYAVIASGQSKGIGSDDYYGYDDGLYDRVAASFAAHDVPVDGQRVSLHQGLFDDTLHPTAPVALAHIDSDWYDPVKTCLERIYPQLSSGGLVVLDDYNDFRGCREAVDEFLAATPDMSLHDTSSNATLIRG